MQRASRRAQRTGEPVGRLFLVLLGAAAGVAAAVLLSARAQLARSARHEGMPDVTADPEGSADEPSVDGGHPAQGTEAPR